MCTFVEIEFMNKKVYISMKNCHKILLFTFLFLGGSSLFSQSPCDPNGIHPFCTDENPYGITYSSGTTGDASVFFGTSSRSCLYSMPAPAYYYMRISSPGDLLIFIRQVGTDGYDKDVDFACWGPYQASNQAAFVQNLCSGQYTLDNNSSGSHRPSDGYHDPNNPNTWGGYPNGNVVDCSYSASGTEWCYIPNAQVGEFYLLLLTNYSRQPATITFTQQGGSASTDCSLLAGISYNGPLCEGETIIFSCDNYQQGATYSWSGPNNWTSNLQNPVIQNATVNMSGTYHFQMTHQGETVNESIEVVINPLPTITISPAAPALCNNDTVTLTASGAQTYLWSTSATSSSITVAPEGTTTYRVLGTSAEGCTATASVTVKVGITNTYVLPDEVCSGTRITVSPYIPSVSYVWDTGESSHSIIPTVTTPTQYVVTITDTNGCVVKDSLMVYPMPVADFVPDAYYKEMENGEALIQFIDLSQGALHWYWTFGDDGAPGNISYEQSPFYIYTHSGFYKITQIVSGDHNCADTTFKRVEMKNPFEFYIPSAFTPYRENGLNDVFAPKGIGISETDYLMVIYNKLGQEIFRTTEVLGGWNGKLKNGDVAPLDVYVYCIRLLNMNNEEKVFYGTVTLIR